MNIEEYIPFGQKNAISRKRLSGMTGLPDRQNRKMIEIARRTVPIINLQDGNGYFRPLPEERNLVFQWIVQENNRAKQSLVNLKGAKKFLRRQA